MPSRKEIAVEFLSRASSGQVREAYELHVHPDFIHHNAYFKGDRDSLLRAMEEAHQSTQNNFLDVKHVTEGDGLVWVHSHVQQKDGTDIAVVHIFRFEGSQIIELWDVGMVVPKDAPNENGPF
jgi:predicted SnoaL-like aldol condensation-catalyzing enzyme